ncbi:ABC transporter ATP-binding protein [Dehalogenimonas alkenigignens]|uniref:ABC-type cobalamin/Fe3+-siderophores transport system, ATPase component n=1 Tax=Dehalogenimonas alkenigignens TaxID=1217799 RepID=A0A0W0GJ48_9CHLR|nr:ABC transporter ATP-binding protein [Dehalogenimonas alkenigignens]KTB48592.1 ABC-type cobalamin/Fe3+-siderophores transport system, ATPase component [Dehalogenimonas alkenigignens]PVV84969.1 ABC transporter ATP-binding protein [Dehalogenimonas alkenigignens]
MKTLEAHNLTLAYGTKEVVHNMSFQAVPGEMVGLVGPNGSGKSTIIKALCRVLNPREGWVKANGHDIAKMHRREMAKLISVVPQTPVLPSAFTAFEIVLMGRNPHLGTFQYESSRDLSIAWQAMERCGVQQFADRRISELSGGEIQSVVIARALAQETECILLDEPTANLDIGRQIEVLDLLKEECHRRNLTVIAAIHDLNLAAHYCEKLVLIKKGTLFAFGTPQEVITTDNICQVYGQGSYVHTHPLSGLPAVLPKVSNLKDNNKCAI